MITIKFTADQINYIGNILGKCPYAEVQAIIASLQSQINEQNQSVKEVKSD